MISNFRLKKKLQSPHGFTLFETLISIALLIIIVGSLGGFVISLQNARAQVTSVHEVDANLRMALDVISQRIRSAQGVNIASSIFDIDPGVLSLEMADGAVNPTVFRLTSDNSILQIQEGVGDPRALTTGSVNVSNLVFSHNSPADEPENIGVSLTIDYAFPSQPYADFTHTATTSNTVRH